MDSTVKARPNHYEVLGLAPTASAEEIAQAFAREISRPRAFGAIAGVSIAYETLRNPDKRRAYDESIGLGPKPEPPPPPFKPYAAHALVATPHLRHDPVVEPRTAAFIAASLRPSESAPSPAPKPEPEARPQSELLRRMEAVASPSYPARAAVAPSLPLVEPDPIPDVEDRPIAWQRPAGVAAGLIVAVGLLGALIGLDAGSDAQSAAPEPVATRALPPARSATRPAPSAAPSFAALDVAPVRRPHALTALRRAEPPTRPPPPSGLADLQLDPPVAEASPAAAPPVEQAAAETVAPAVVEASMPLPKATIARTIGRIGYACGQVASTSAIEGEGPGVFKVTCTSGHSYKAAPQRGRYHFRRMSN